MTLIANINEKISAIPCETSLILNLNLDILVFKFHHTMWNVYVQPGTGHFVTLNSH